MIIEISGSIFSHDTERTARWAQMWINEIEIKVDISNDVSG